MLLDLQPSLYLPKQLPMTMTLTENDYAFYETFQKQVEAFGLAIAFEDRADRNRYRAIDKAVKVERAVR